MPIAIRFQHRDLDNDIVKESEFFGPFDSAEITYDWLIVANDRGDRFWIAYESAVTGVWYAHSDGVTPKTPDVIKNMIERLGDKGWSDIVIVAA